MKVGVEEFLLQLDQIDEALIDLWLETEDNGHVPDEVWEKFVELLELRVSALVTLKDAGMNVDRSLAWPTWLEKLCQQRTSDMKQRVVDMIKQHKLARKIKVYEDMTQ